MNMTYASADGRMEFQIEGDSPKALFKKLSLVQEIFEADNKCGACGSSDIKVQARQHDDFEFFELACRECSARLQFGQHKKGGGLFAKRRDEDGNYLDGNGWTKFQAKTTAAPAAKPNKAQEVDDDVPF